jgi:hypothetical protein
MLLETEDPDSEQSDSSIAGVDRTVRTWFQTKGAPSKQAARETEAMVTSIF